MSAENNGFRVSLLLDDFFKDVRRKSYFYINLSCFSIIEDVEREIKATFGINENINLLADNIFLPPKGNIHILQDGDTIQVVHANPMIGEPVKETLLDYPEECSTIVTLKNESRKAECIASLNSLNDKIIYERSSNSSQVSQTGEKRKKNHKHNYCVDNSLASGVSEVVRSPLSSEVLDESNINCHVHKKKKRKKHSYEKSSVFENLKVYSGSHKLHTCEVVNLNGFEALQKNGQERYEEESDLNAARIGNHTSITSLPSTNTVENDLYANCVVELNEKLQELLKKTEVGCKEMSPNLDSTVHCNDSMTVDDSSFTNTIKVKRKRIRRHKTKRRMNGVDIEAQLERFESQALPVNFVPLHSSQRKHVRYLDDGSVTSEQASAVTNPAVCLPEKAPTVQSDYISSRLNYNNSYVELAHLKSNDKELSMNTEKVVTKTDRLQQCLDNVLQESSFSPQATKTSLQSDDRGNNGLRECPELSDDMCTSEQGGQPQKCNRSKRRTSWDVKTPPVSNHNLFQGLFSLQHKYVKTPVFERIKQLTVATTDPAEDTLCCNVTEHCKSTDIVLKNCNKGSSDDLKPKALNGQILTGKLDGLEEKLQNKWTKSSMDLLDVTRFPIIDSPRKHDVIAFKVLKMAADYTPTVSESIVAKILEIEEPGMSLSLKILYGREEFSEPKGKLYLNDSAECDLTPADNHLLVLWKEMIEPRLLFP